MALRPVEARDLAVGCVGDEQPAAFAFSACTNISCDAQLVIPDGNFEKLEAAGEFALVYVLADGTPVKGMVSMKGLGKAYESIIKPEVTAAPGIELSSVRRSELPSVYPKPGSSGSMTKRERCGLMDSSVSVGRCAISTVCILSASGRWCTHLP